MIIKIAPSKSYIAASSRCIIGALIIAPTSSGFSKYTVFAMGIDRSMLLSARACISAGAAARKPAHAVRLTLRQRTINRIFKGAAFFSSPYTKHRIPTRASIGIRGQARHIATPARHGPRNGTLAVTASVPLAVSCACNADQNRTEASIP